MRAKMKHITQEILELAAASVHGTPQECEIVTQKVVMHGHTFCDSLSSLQPMPALKSQAHRHNSALQHPTDRLPQHQCP